MIGKKLKSLTLESMKHLINKQKNTPKILVQNGLQIAFLELLENMENQRLQVTSLIHELGENLNQEKKSKIYG